MSSSETASSPGSDTGLAGGTGHRSFADHEVVGQIASDGRRLIEVARGNLDAAVPACPGWVMRDLVGHMGRVHRMVAANLERRSTEPMAVAGIEAPPDDDSVVAYAAAALDALLGELDGIDPATPVWSWTSQGDASFFFRRMLHETAVHRWDAENAAGDPKPIDGDQGADGIDELCLLLLPAYLARKQPELPTGSLHLHRSDGAGEWILSVDSDRIAVGHAHAKGDAALRGPGGALLLAMWGRNVDADIELFGDEAVARAWRALAP